MSSHPPVLLVVLDTLRADFLGDPALFERLPTLRSLAAESLVFTRAYAPTHWTLPSHASLFTGLPPDEHTARPPDMRLQDGVPTLPEIYRREGYRTVCVSCNAFVSDLFGLARGFEVVEHPPIRGTPPPLSVLQSRMPTDRGILGAVQTLADSLLSIPKSDPKRDNGARSAVRFVRGMAHTDPRPLFLFVNLMEVHSPYHARGDQASWRSRVRGREVFARFEETAFASMSGRRPISGDTQRILTHAYWRNAEYLDARLGELLHALPDDLLREGYVVVVSDHGQMLGEKGEVDHVGGLAEQLIRVPLLIRPPGGAEGRSVPRPVSITWLFYLLQAIARCTPDALPSWMTSLDRIGLVVSEARPGIIPYLHSPSRGRHRHDVLWQRDVLAFHRAYSRSSLAAVFGPWKLVCHMGDGEDELYNLESDPDEAANMASSQPDILESLHERLRNRFSSPSGGDIDLGTRPRRDLLPLSVKRQISEVIILGATNPGSNPAILWTGGKDSTLVLHLALHALREHGRPVPPTVLVDHGQHFPETLAFMGEVAQREGLRIIYARNEPLLAAADGGEEALPLEELDSENQKEALRAGLQGDRVPLSLNTQVGNHLLKTVALNRTIEKEGFDNIITGIRWDENPARSAEVFFSPRENPDHIRVHPILPWTEREVWRYTLDLKIPIHPLYRRGYRSLDGVHDSLPTDSRPAWEQDLEGTRERAGRAQDKEHMMERLRRLGYF